MGPKKENKKFLCKECGKDPVSICCAACEQGICNNDTLDKDCAHSVDAVDFKSVNKDKIHFKGSQILPENRPPGWKKKFRNHEYNKKTSPLVCACCSEIYKQGKREDGSDSDSHGGQRKIKINVEVNSGARNGQSKMVDSDSDNGSVEGSDSIKLKIEACDKAKVKDKVKPKDKPKVKTGARNCKSKMVDSDSDSRSS